MRHTGLYPRGIPDRCANWNPCVRRRGGHYNVDLKLEYDEYEYKYKFEYEYHVQHTHNLEHFATSRGNPYSKFQP